MKLSTRLFGRSYRFRSVKEVLARANEARSGDQLAGIAARSERERIAAKTVLADLTLNDLRENPVVAYDRDEVTRVIDDAIDRDAFAAVRNKTACEFREWLLDDATTGDAILATGRAITADIIERTGVPTQNCVLGHITTQMRALEAGAPMDIMFQSLAGTEKGN